MVVDYVALYLHTDSSKELRLRLRRELADVQTKWKSHKGGACTVFVLDRDNGPVRLARFLRTISLQPSYSYAITQWTDEEMTAAPWHSLRVSRRNRGHLYGRREPPHFEDEGACPKCGTGTRLPHDGVFIKNAPRLTGEVMSAVRGTLVVSSAFLERAKAAKLKGLVFIPVFYESSGTRFDDAWAVQARVIAPRQHANTDLVHEDGCSCGRESWFDDEMSRGRYAYEEALESRVDALETWEHLAYGRRPAGREFVCAVPRLLVSRRFYAAFRGKAKEHRFEYTPVKFVRSP